MEVYKVVSKNLDISTKNKEKEKYEKFFNLYRNISYYLFISINTLKELKYNKNTNALNIVSPSFLSMTIKNIWLSCVVNISSFFSNDKMSFNKFFNYIKANHNLIFTGIFQDVTENYYGKGKDKIVDIKYNTTILQVVEECENLINDNKEEIENINTVRNKIFAHFSDDRDNYQETLKQINIDVLYKLIKLIETIANKINVRYDRIVYSFEPSNSADINGTLSELATYQEYRKEIFELKYRNATVNKNKC